ncbi:pyridoxal phosphate-dependent transferase [Ilyonectria sp. MPI-CAGE-AT-0026]|nr:pyridoxal phosphate-dependent transferase [Ilyonectria sp. MPI-CAGE-AT-0026]
MQRHLGPSRRALEASQRETVWDLMMENKHRLRYDPEHRPDGLIDLSGAVNTLMADWAEEPSQALSYGSLHGSNQLLSAAAGFFNAFFHPRSPVSAANILAANGVTSLFDLAAWAMCEPGDAVLVLTPTFFMLDFHLSLRAGVVMVPLSTEDLDDPFGETTWPQLLAALDAAADTAIERDSLRCRALIICNPANPQGRCYSRKSLQALASWCAGRNLHLISDEIYALSNFAHVHNDADKYKAQGYSPAELSKSSFCSVLSLAADDEPLAQNLHCFYSLSKDFGMGGLRMGFWVTKNSAILQAAATATWFTWITSFSDHFSTNFIKHIDIIGSYLIEYRRRLGAAYLNTIEALSEQKIPYTDAEAGLFLYLDLSGWIRFLGEGEDSTLERRLCQLLLDAGVFVNPGQFSGSRQPGQFRLVFTIDGIAVTMAIHRIREALDNLERQGRLREAGSSSGDGQD